MSDSKPASNIALYPSSVCGATSKERFENIGFKRRATSQKCSIEFSHIFAGGYAAGYYSYKWAEVLAADGFSLFEEKGIFDKETASKFRHLLEQGGSVEAAKLYREFRGHDPEPEALLRQLEIIK